jgi:hypothetical protein
VGASLTDPDETAAMVEKILQGYRERVAEVEGQGDEDPDCA